MDSYIEKLKHIDNDYYTFMNKLYKSIEMKPFKVLYMNNESTIQQYDDETYDLETMTYFVYKDIIDVLKFKNSDLNNYKEEDRENKKFKICIVYTEHLVF